MSKRLCEYFNFFIASDIQLISMDVFGLVFGQERTEAVQWLPDSDHFAIIINL